MDPPVHKFKWGYRAKVEITKSSLLDFVCRIYGGPDVCKPEDWLTQYADCKMPDQFNTNTEQEANQDLSMQDETAVNSQTQASANRSKHDTDLYSQGTAHTQRFR